MGVEASPHPVVITANDDGPFMADEYDGFMAHGLIMVTPKKLSTSGATVDFPSFYVRSKGWLMDNLGYPHFWRL